jgi:hypothetical protein
MLGDYEPCYGNGYLNRGRCCGLWCGNVPDLANLAVLLVGGLRVPVRERVGA